MSTIETALEQHMLATAAIAAVVGTNVFPVVRPQGSGLPCIVYSRLAGPRVENLTGSSGVAHPQFQTEIYATTYAVAKALAELVRLALADKTGTLHGVDGVSIRMIGDYDFYEQEDPVWRVVQRWEIHHQEPRAVSLT